MAGGRHSGAVISHEAPRRPREPGQPAVQSTVGLAPTETRRAGPLGRNHRRPAGPSRLHPPPGRHRSVKTRLTLSRSAAIGPGLLLPWSDGGGRCRGEKLQFNGHDICPHNRTQNTQRDTQLHHHIRFRKPENQTTPYYRTINKTVSLNQKLTITCTETTN